LHPLATSSSSISFSCFISSSDSLSFFLFLTGLWFSSDSLSEPSISLVLFTNSQTPY
jgi:hypothetical protein